MDKFGKIVVLAMSVVFCVFVIWALSTGIITQWNQTALGAFWFFVIVLGGPIAYYFSNTVSDRADISTPVGKATLVGGYAVSVAAYGVVTFFPPPDPKPVIDPLAQTAWRKCVLDNDLADDITDARSIVVTNLDGNGHLLEVPLVNERSRVEFYCCFDPKQKNMIVYIGIPSVVDGRREIQREIKREGEGAIAISVRKGGVAQ